MKNIALALSSGGPRGFAYIGAIEELLRRGYSITSVSGASAGALIGGIYAAGGLPAFKEWLLHLDPLQIVAQLDVAPSKNYLLKGDKIIETIKARVPEVNIEDLPIPFTAVATDLHTGEEVLFREGPLFDAIRASISIPSMFRPVKWQGRTLIDGGIANTFPLNRVARTPGDILAGFNVNRIDAESIRAFLEKEGLTDGIMAHLEKRRVPYVLAGSIRDDGPLPEVTGNVYEAQNKMRDQVRGATTVICLATMLHSIAVGNMTPSYRVMPDGTIREVYFYCVDISEFTANKLGDRGSLSAKGIVTNVQDFIVTLCAGLGI